MVINLKRDEIIKLRSDGLLVQIDGQMRVLGGPPAAKALKMSIHPEDREELFDYLEKKVKRIKQMPPGKAMVMDISEVDSQWEYLILISAIPHHVDDIIISSTQYASILKSAMLHAIHEILNEGLTSLAMTPVGISYRMPYQLSLRSMAEALARYRSTDFSIHWSLVNDNHFNYARKICDQLNLTFQAFS